MNALKLTTLCAAVLAVGLAGCNRTDDDVAAAPDLVPPAATDATTDMPPAGTDMTPTGGEGVLTVATAGSGGIYIADSAGNALYMLENDADGTACVGDCLETWPPVLVTDAQPTVDLGVDLDPALLGTIERPDGTLQVTYNGHPLYRYAADTGANRIAGHGLDDRWGEWYLLTPTGVEFEAGTAADADVDADAEVEVDADDDY